MAENTTNNAFTPANAASDNMTENRQLSGTTAQGQAPSLPVDDLNAISTSAGNPFANSSSAPVSNVNAAASTLAATGLASHTLLKPEAGKTATLQVAPGEIIAAQFDPNSANLSMNGKDLVMSFNDGSQIILQGFASDISDMPAIALPDGALVSGGIIVAQLQGTNEDIFNLETAANASAGGGGNFIYSDDLGGVINLLDKLPPILFSALEFSEPQVQVVVGDPEIAAIPNNPPGGSFVPNITTEISNPDGTTTIVAGGFEDWQANQHVGDFTITPMGLNIVFTPQDNEVVDQVTISNIPDGVQFFYRDANGVTSPMTITNGSLTLSGADLASGNIFILPPSNSDADIPFTISLLIRDPETGETAILAQNVLAVVDAVADQPTLDSTISIGGGAFTNGTVSGSEEQVIAIRLNTAFPDNDGSETHTVIIKGVPAEWTLVDAQGLTFTSVVAADGTVTYTAIVTGDVNNVISFQPNNWSSENNGTAVLTVISTTTENVTDGEIRTDNNTASVEVSFGVEIAEDKPTLVAVTTPALIPEANLLVPGTNEVDGTITVDFHTDGPGDVSLTLDGLPNLGLTSDGNPLTYTLSPDGKTITATTPDGTPIFTIEVTPGSTPGNYDYTFTLQGPLDHAPGQGNNHINIPVHFVATDSDGDTVSGSIPIVVVDDVPTAAPVSNNTDETSDLGTALVGNIDVDFGADGIGSVELNGFNASGSLDNGTLTSGGVPVVVTLVNGVYVGMAGNTQVFTMSIDPATGQYSFTQYAPLDHADGSNPNDVINLTFDFTATDNDGDSVNSTITIRVLDDAPIAVDDVITATDDAPVATGNVMDNDTMSRDTDNSLQDISFDGTTYSFANPTGTDAGGAFLIINGQYGTLKIYANGEYTYTYNDTNFSGVYTDEFTYTLVDFDGDSDTAKLTITITDNGTDVVPVIVRTIDETDDIGSVISGTITVPNGDGFALTTVTTGGSMEGGSLSSGGVPVTMTLVNGEYIGMAGSTHVFTLTLDPQTGAYTFTLHAPLDHADGNNPDDIIDLVFGYNVSDANGNTASGTITVHVKDDAPIAVDDVINATANNPVVTGDVTANDNMGQDAGHDDKLESVTVNGTTHSFANPTGSDAGGAYLLVAGQYGTLKIYENGQYTYTYDAASHAGDLVDTFSYTLIDRDGDTDTANLTINIHDGVPSVIDVTPPAGAVNEADLPNGAEVGGTITVDFNNEGPGSVTLTDEGLDNLGLTSEGEPLSYTVSPDGQTITATTPDGTPIFTVTVTPGANPGEFDYTFTLEGPLDHAPGQGTNELDIPIRFVATDNDGDTATGVIPVTVKDDVPVVNALPTNLDETTTLNMPFSGSLNVDFGADGPAETDALVFNGFSAGGSLMGGALTSGGVPVVVSVINGVYVGMAGNTQVFTMSMDAATGQYTFTQFAPLDHADGNDINDIISLQFQFTATDYDGDSTSGTIIVRIRDDAPIAIDDVVTMDDSNPVAIGNVMDNDTMSNDVENTLQSVAFDGTTYSFANPTGTDAGGAFLIINGQYGTLKIYENGQYTYTYSDGNFAGTYTDEFTYTLVDFDGDTDTAKLTINITDNGPHIPTVIIHTIDETDDIGSVISGDASIPGADSFALTTVDASGSLMGGALSSGGVPVTISLVNGEYVGMAGSTPVFTLTLNPQTGAYTFVQHAPLDHADGSNPNDVISLTFGYNVSDANGNTLGSTITVHVRDDAPVAVADVNSVTDGNPTATGNILTNDVMSVDDSHTIHSLGFGNNTYSFDNPTGIDANGVFLLIPGDHGTLKIYQNGNYTYTYNDNNFSGEYIDQFNYTLRDFDGDTSSTTLTIKILDTGVDTAPAVVRIVDETNQIGDSISGTITVQNADSFALTTADASGSLMNGALSSNGQPVTITLVNGQYVGMVAGSTSPVFTLTLNPQTGAYTFVQHKPLDHADGSNPNDVINLTFGYSAYDSNGNSVSSTITVHVRDDAPIAVQDYNTVQDHTTTATGNVLLNDTMSVDTSNLISQAGFGGNTASFDGPTLSDAGGPFVLIQGQYGTLKLYQNGNYVYTYDTMNHVGNHTEVFNYTLRDFDGDTSTTTLTINIIDSGPSTPPEIIRTIDETTDIGLAVTGFIPILSQPQGGLTLSLGNGDGQAQFDAYGSLAGGSLKSHGVAIVVTLENGVYVGKAGSITVFTLTMNAGGQYTFKQFAPIDHADGSNPNDVISLRFRYSVTDGDGDSASNNIIVHVRDDAPVAVADVNTVASTASSTSGNVMTNDDLSVDAGNFVTSVGAGFQVVNFNGQNSVEINGTYGKLTIYANGTYSYTLHGGQNQIGDGTNTDVFNYTIRDYDGDASSTTLTITSTQPKLVVGSNDGDNGNNGPGYHIGNGSGTIIGTGGSDILVGDFGGSNAGPGEDFNIVMILDTSASMNIGGKLAMLKDAVKNLMEDFSNYTGGTIKVRFITFNNNVASTATFTITNAAEYLAAINFINGLTVGQDFTNYEAPLQSAIQWLNSGSAIPGATNFTYFVSDGEPNRALDNSGNVIIRTPSQAMGEITGTDGTNEVGILKGLGHVVAVGIGVNSTTMGRLDVIDSDGNAIHVNNPGDLNSALGDNNPVPDVSLENVGNDVINGGDGDDIIFGDSVNTDVLAQNMGVDLPSGSGWAVFDYLEAHHSGWTRQSTIDYIRNNLEELARENHTADGSGRSGGNDTITGGSGNDVIFGQEGNDVINGGAGNDIISGGSGNNILTGGAGSDTFLFIKGSTGHDTITDYSNAQNDRLDISDLLTGTSYHPGGNAANYVKIDGNTGQVFVDATGSGNFNSSNHVATINNASSMDTINVILHDSEGVKVIHTV